MTQTLDKLSAAATQARVLESRVNNRWQVTLDFGDDKDAMRHFSDLYRTGQLVEVQADDATVERMQEAYATFGQTGHLRTTPPSLSPKQP